MDDEPTQQRIPLSIRKLWRNEEISLPVEICIHARPYTLMPITTRASMYIYIYAPHNLTHLNRSYSHRRMKECAWFLQAEAVLIYKTMVHTSALRAHALNILKRGLTSLASRLSLKTFRIWEELHFAFVDTRENEKRVRKLLTQPELTWIRQPPI